MTTRMRPRKSHALQAGICFYGLQYTAKPFFSRCGATVHTGLRDGDRDHSATVYERTSSSRRSFQVGPALNKKQDHVTNRDFWIKLRFVDLHLCAERLGRRLRALSSSRLPPPFHTPRMREGILSHRLVIAASRTRSRIGFRAKVGFGGAGAGHVALDALLFILN